LQFHFRDGSLDGLTRAVLDMATDIVGGLEVNAKTAVSMAFSRSCMPGSGLPCWAQSFAIGVVAKQSSHRGMEVALPVKQIVYRVELIIDHWVLPVIAACLG